MVGRRNAVGLLLGLFLKRLEAGVVDLPRVAVVMGAAAPAYQEAIRAFRATLGQAARLSLHESEGEQAKASLDYLRQTEPNVAVAFGSQAMEALATARLHIPVIATMVLDPDGARESGQKPVSTVSLFVPPATVLSNLRALFPKYRRLGVVFSSLSGLSGAELQALGQRLGYMLQPILCSGPREVIESFSAFRGQVDMVWCVPDSTLFPPAAVGPMLIASIRSSLAVLGFSESFVRAGAVAGFYPDYADIGAQTAEFTLRLLAGQELPARVTPRKVRAAINDRVLRVLGLERPRVSGEVLIIR